MMEKTSFNSETLKTLIYCSNKKNLKKSNANVNFGISW